MLTRRPLESLVTLAWMVLAAVLVFTPSWATVAQAKAVAPFCLLCGGRPFADAILNVAFFVPLGWLLGRRWGTGRAVGAAFLMTVAIEVLQAWIPGRFSSASDVLANTLGAGLGAWGVGREWRVVPWLAVGAILAVLAPLTLLAPAAPAGVYYGQWTALFGNMGHYEGRVLAATIDGIDVPSRRSSRTPELRRALVSGAPVVVRFVAGPPPEDLAPIFSVFDERARRILLVGAEENDVVVQRWTRATTLGLDSPGLRFRDALADAEVGDTLTLRFSNEHAGPCLTINARTRCDTRIDGGSGWTLLLSRGGLTAPLAAGIGLLWMVLMGILLGLPSWRPWLRMSLGFLLAVVSMAISSDLPYLNASLPKTLGLVAGVAAGLLIQRRIATR